VQNSARKEGYFSEHSVVKSSRSDTLVKEALIEIGCVVTSLVVDRWLVGCHARALWPNGAS